MTLFARQNAEFNAAHAFAEQLRRLNLTAVVDDDYPAVRHDYDAALCALIAACEKNGRAMRYYHAVTGGLSFNDLRAANITRLPTFRNRHGRLAHTASDGSDWNIAEWLQAVVGELGEYANVAKKYQRGDLTPEEFAHRAASELADVQIYLDLLAFRLGIDLGAATFEKFNEVSVRVGSPIFLRKYSATDKD